MARLVKADGTITEVKPHKQSGFTLEELHNFVGGFIEIVRIAPGQYGLLSVAPDEIMVCNEDGHRLGLAVNRTASAIYNFSGGLPFPVVGDVLIAKFPQEVD